MKTAGRASLVSALALLLGLSPFGARAQEASDAAASADTREWEDDPGWPRVIDQDDVTFSIYQPQIDTFEDDVLEARAAVSVETTPPDANGKKQTHYGVVWIKARTQIDKDAGLVHLDQIEITRAKFPGEPEKADEYLAIIRGQAETERTISLARIQANLAITQADRKGRSVPLKNDPPRVFYSTIPALLVLVDSDPVLRPVEGQSIQRVVNTRALMLYDGSRYYLPLMDRWIQASALDGAWSLGTPPPAAEALRRSIASDPDQTQVDLLDDPAEDVKTLVQQGSLPRVYVSTAPAELIVTRGKPQMTPIAGTQLLFVSNTDQDIFLDLDGQNYFVPMSGRWYRGASLNGPWDFVDGKKLPADFGKIPAGNPKASVLATVPGTTQAREALIANSIPQTAEVKRDEAKIDPQYDGQPQFQPVQDTPLRYAVNSPTPVIEVDPGTYYAVQDGIWYTAGAPIGPWAVAISVPAVIYSIPTASPIHYVTYVRIYRYTPTVVYVGYTPGYMGTCYSSWGTVVYGTGWYYRPWIGSVWLGYPWTWGFGVHIGWSAWSGVNIGVGWGGYRPWRPWWGPYGYGWGRPRPPVPYWGRPGRPITINHLNVYNRRPGVIRPVVRPSRPGGAVPVRPNPNPRPGQRPAPSNPGTRPAPTNPGGRPAPRPVTRPDVYAGKDGNVYRPAPNGSWQQYSGKDWKPMPSEAARPAPQRPSQPQPQVRPVESPSSLTRERQARQAGDSRANPQPQRQAPSRPAPSRPSSPPKPHN